MGIEWRPDNVRLTTETILEKVSGFEIFEYYYPGIELNKPFRSDLRRDSHPSCSIQLWGGCYFYKDFATGETYTCFQYVMKKFGLNFLNALEKINYDLNLNLTTTPTDVGRKAKPGDIKFEEEKPTRKKKKITIVTKGFNNEDRAFWQKYGIEIKDLIHFNVYPISAYYYCGTRYNTSDSLSYAYKIFNSYKIYRPFKLSKNKWRSNTSKRDIQGWQQLPDKGEVLVLTSSLKDIMVLYKMGYPAIALQSESEVPHEDMIKHLKKRFKQIVILYDNDFNAEENWGQIGAEKIAKEFGLKNLCIPSEYKSKDPSDLVYNVGFESAQQIIKSLWI